MFAIPKKVVDGVIVKARFVVDPLHINEHIPTVDYPLPQIADIHELIGGARFYSTLDLESGYHQFWVADADRPKTAITVDNVRYKFHRCPFGFKHLPAIFQRVMNGLLRDLLYVLVSLHRRCHCLGKLPMRNGYPAEGRYRSSKFSKPPDQL